MNDILKQRMIGALILLALAVVFWPIIFVQPEHKEATEPQPSPPPPVVSTEPIEPPDATDLRTSPEIAAATEAETIEGASVAEEITEPAAGAVPAPQTQAGKPTVSSQGSAQGSAQTPAQATVQSGAPGATRTVAPQPLKMDANGVPQAWTLQVATVSSAEKAEDLRKRLLAMNQKAYVTTVSSGGNRLYRVCVGPKLERAELAAIQSRINAQFGVTTMIVRYIP